MEFCKTLTESLASVLNGRNVKPEAHIALAIAAAGTAISEAIVLAAKIMKGLK